MQFDVSTETTDDEVKVIIDKRVLRGYIRRALRKYPKEYIETLWGRIKGNVITIISIQEISHEATKDDITYEDDHLFIQAEDAEDEKLTLLGTIHTHPDMHDASPSDYDWEIVTARNDIVSGICAIWKVNTRRHTKTKFWPHLPACKVVEKEREHE